MRLWTILQFLALTVCLAGCYPDPFQNPGDWSMTGASRKNTAAQVETPSQLINGQQESGSNGVAASAAIDKALGGPAGTAAGLQTPPAATMLNITGS
jgi:hypothetical protein